MPLLVRMRSGGSRDLDLQLQRFLFEIFPRQPHSGLDGMTPQARFEQGLVMVGAAARFPASADLRFLLLPLYRRGTAMVHSRRGIHVENVDYWHADMRSAELHRTTVPVRVDPYDVTHVVAFINGRWVLCRADCALELAGYSRRELRLASSEWHRRRRGAGQRRMPRARELAKVLAEIRKTEDGLRQARRDEERSAVLKQRGLSLVADSGSTRDAASGSDTTPWDSVGLDELGPGKRR